MKPSQRNQQLDVLRAIAILLVLGRHSVVEPQSAGILSSPATLWMRFGWTGVDLFFVLSGFLLGGLLFSEFALTGKIDVRRFLIRRSFKIWPDYYVLLIFVILVTPVSGDTFAERLTTYIPHLFHLQNYFRYLSLHTWSLAVEEHFYLALPLLLWTTFKLTQGNKQRRFTIVAVAASLVVIICLTLRLCAEVPLENLGARLSPTHLRVDSLCWGVFLAAIYHLKTNWFAALLRHRLLIALAGLAIISPMMVLSIENSLFVTTWGYSLLYIGYGCLLIAAVSGGDNKRHSYLARLLAFIGTSSYSTYLWHWHLAYLFKALVPTIRSSGIPPAFCWLLLTMAYVVTAIAVGWFMGRLVEVPMLKFRDRIFPSNTSSPTVVRISPPSTNEASAPVLADPASNLAG